MRLNTTERIHLVFNISQLHLAASDPLSGQSQDDLEPGPIKVNREKEYVVEAILEERVKRKKKEYLVKWLGYPTPNWQPTENLDDTEALQD